jgi:hypothetical protein
MSTATLIVKYKHFHGEFRTWDAVFAKAAEFAAHIGRERLIGISHSNAVVAVWYWAEPGEVDA